MQYTGGVAWTVHFSPEAELWLSSLTDEQFDSMIAAVEMLEQDGPTLGRPAVDSIKGSRHRNMKRAAVVRWPFARAIRV